MLCEQCQQSTQFEVTTKRFERRRKRALEIDITQPKLITNRNIKYRIGNIVVLIRVSSHLKFCCFAVTGLSIFISVPLLAAVSVAYTALVNNNNNNNNNIGTDRMVCGAGCVQLSGVRPSVSSSLSPAAAVRLLCRTPTSLLLRHR